MNMKGQKQKKLKY